MVYKAHLLAASINPPSVHSLLLHCNSFYSSNRRLIDLTQAPLSLDMTDPTTQARRQQYAAAVMQLEQSGGDGCSPSAGPLISPPWVSASDRTPSEVFVRFCHFSCCLFLWFISLAKSLPLYSLNIFACIFVGVDDCSFTL